MRMGWIRLAAVAAGALLLATSAIADPLNDGMDAYERGDYASAVRLIQPLAEKGDPYAEYDIGLMYELGHGLPQNFSEARRWYGYSAQQGLAEAQNNMGRLSYNGWGTARDYAEAKAWFEMAAKHDLSLALYNLARLHQFGQGVPANIDEAKRLYQLASDKGLAEAKISLQELQQSNVKSNNTGFVPGPMLLYFYLASYIGWKRGFRV